MLYYQLVEVIRLEEEKGKPQKILKSKESHILAALSYVSVFSVVMYIVKKDDSFVEFHAKQGIIIFVLSLIGMFPVLGWPLLIVSVILMVVGASKAYVGEKYKIPVVAGFAEKINF